MTVYDIQETYWEDFAWEGKRRGSLGRLRKLITMQFPYGGEREGMKVGEESF